MIPILGMQRYICQQPGMRKNEEPNSQPRLKSTPDAENLCSLLTEATKLFLPTSFSIPNFCLNIMKMRHLTSNVQQNSEISYT